MARFDRVQRMFQNMELAGIKKQQKALLDQQAKAIAEQKNKEKEQKMLKNYFFSIEQERKSVIEESNNIKKYLELGSLLSGLEETGFTPEKLSSLTDKEYAANTINAIKDDYTKTETNLNDIDKKKVDEIESLLEQLNEKQNQLNEIESKKKDKEDVLLKSNEVMLKQLYYGIPLTLILVGWVLLILALINASFLIKRGVLTKKSIQAKLEKEFGSSINDLQSQINNIKNDIRSIMD